MIPVTRLDGVSILLNDEVVQWIEQTPDTLLGLLNGERVLVRESPEELLRRIVAFKRSVMTGPALRAVAARAPEHNE
jgi:flagellar protein FlbD